MTGLSALFISLLLCTITVSVAAVMYGRFLRRTPKHLRLKRHYWKHASWGTGALALLILTIYAVKWWVHADLDEAAIQPELLRATDFFAAIFGIIVLLAIFPFNGAWFPRVHRALWRTALLPAIFLFCLGCLMIFQAEHWMRHLTPWSF